MNKIELKKQIAQAAASTTNPLPIDIYKQAAAICLEQHKRCDTAYYSVVYSDHDYISEYLQFVPLTAENIAEISAAIAADEMEDVEQVLCNLADCHYLQRTLAGRDLIPVDIDIDHPYYLYGVTVAVFNDDITAAPEIIYRKVELTDEQYQWLVYRYMVHPYTSFNELRTLNNELYNKILAQVEANIETEPVQLPIPTFALSLTQIATDASQLKAIIEEVVSK